MKKCLFPEDVMELSETQKGALRKLWQPVKYDLAVEIVWKDVENNLCDGVTLLVTDMGARAGYHQYYEVLLKVLYLEDRPQITINDPDSETASDDSAYEDSLTEPDIDDAENEIELANGTQVASSGSYILSKESCLPLLSIGQMIEILVKNRSELNIALDPEEAVCYINGKEFYGEEICDTLWEAVKTLL